ncbi:pilin [Nitrospira sp. KM1]|nr:pilin [Nitrospira sp. KM1]
MKTRQQSPPFGGTLTELMTVLVIIGILVAIAMPSYNRMLIRMQSKSAATEIASELRMARQLAMSRRERLRVRFDRVRQTITLERADAGGVLDIYRYAEKGIALDEPTGGSEVLFHPSGRSATATTIAIVDKEGKKIVLTVSLTGRVTLS